MSQGKKRDSIKKQSKSKANYKRTELLEELLEQRGKQLKEDFYEKVKVFPLRRVPMSFEV